jgi:hypothetical protein
VAHLDLKAGPTNFREAGGGSLKARSSRSHGSGQKLPLELHEPKIWIVQGVNQALMEGCKKLGGRIWIRPEDPFAVFSIYFQQYRCRSRRARGSPRDIIDNADLPKKTPRFKRRHKLLVASRFDAYVDLPRKDYEARATRTALGTDHGVCRKVPSPHDGKQLGQFRQREVTEQSGLPQQIRINLRRRTANPDRTRHVLLMLASREWCNSLNREGFWNALVYGR